MCIEIVDDSFMICQDCACIALCGDASALDYYYPNSKEAAAREREIGHALEALADKGQTLHSGEVDNDEEFSRQDCDLCGSDLAGSRIHCTLVQHVEDKQLTLL